MSQKRLSKELRKGQIANIAAELFAKKGFNGVTTKEIAKKAKVNEAIIFRYFPTKEHLYNEIINQKVKVSPDMLDLSAMETGDDRKVLRSIADLLLKEVEKDSTFLRLVFFSSLEGHKLAELFLQSRTNIPFDFLLSYVTKRREDGAFKDIKPMVMTRSFFSMIFNYVLVKELFNVPKEMKLTDSEAVEGFIDIFLNGVKC